VSAAKQTAAGKTSTAAAQNGQTSRTSAAHELNGPSFAHRILTTAELLAALPGE